MIGERTNKKNMESLDVTRKVKVKVKGIPF